MLVVVGNQPVFFEHVADNHPELQLTIQFLIDTGISLTSLIRWVLTLLLKNAGSTMCPSPSVAPVPPRGYPDFAEVNHAKTQTAEPTFAKLKVAKDEKCNEKTSKGRK